MIGSGGTSRPDTSWERARVSLKFQIGDLVLARAALTLYRRSARVDEDRLDAGDKPHPPPELDGADGYVVWSQPMARRLSALSASGTAIVYIPRQYRRFSIDLTGSFDDYMATFSSKTRSSLKRKLRKFAEMSQGAIDWREYRTPDQIADFVGLARKLSAKTYQERLLGVGLPAGDGFLSTARALASRGSVRGYLLFLNGTPISYLYCPVDDGVVLYDHLGYDPAHAALSPGTILQLLALEALFAERRFVLFDFTEGEGQHKELFSTGSRLCGDVYVIDRRLVPASVVLLHRAMDKISASIGIALDRLHLKSNVRRLLRQV